MNRNNWQVRAVKTTPSGRELRRGTAAEITTDLEYKRSFFVRMVSDPKIYNPKIVAKSLTLSGAEPIAEMVVADNQKESQWGRSHLDC